MVCPTPSAEVFNTQRPVSVLETNGKYLAFTGQTPNSMLLADLGNLSTPPLELSIAHEKSITAMCMWGVRMVDAGPESMDEPEETTLLVTASKDSMMLWNVEGCFLSSEEGVLPQPEATLSQSQGLVEAISVDATGTLIACCIAAEVHIFQVPCGRCVFRLQGHQGIVTAAAFCLHQPSLLVSTAEDRTFKVWDLEEGSLVFGSHILCAAALTCLAMDPAFPRVAIGAADGVLRIFDLSNPACRQIQMSDVGLLSEKIAAKQAADFHQETLLNSPGKTGAAAGPKVITPSRRRLAGSAEADLSDLTSVPPGGGAGALMAGCGVTTLFYLPPPLVAAEGSSSAGLVSASLTALSPLSAPPSTLVVGMPSACAVLDTRTYEIQHLHTYTQVGLPPPPALASLDKVGTARAYSAWSGFQRVSTGDERGPNSLEAVCCVSSAFNPVVVTLRWTSGDETSNDPSAESTSFSGSCEQGLLSVFPSEALPEGSPLLKNGEFLDKPKERNKDDKPVTFHTKIKSSGYGSERPWERPSSAKGSKKSSASSSSSSSKLAQPKSKGNLQKLCQTYPVDCEPLLHLQAKNVLSDGKPLHSAAVTQIRYSGDGSRLASASVDKTARVVRLPLSRYGGDGTDLIAHKGAVNSVSWSHDNSMVLTAGTDRCAFLWNSGKADPALSFTHLQRPYNSSDAKLNPAFNTEVKVAKFFYLDRFILLACGAKICLYRFKLAPAEDPKNDLKRLQQNSLNKYKLVASYSSTSQSISAMACSNSFLSNLVLCSGSNRSLEVLDLGCGKWVRTIEEMHSRPAHTLELHGASPYASHPQEAYELFATGHCDIDGGCVKLWDLRSQKCISRLTGHTNRQHPVGLQFSPCLRFLATGGEDRAAVIYDLRMGTPLHRLREGHTDVVSDVAYHPLHPQLATACLDGRVRFFSDSP